MSALLLEPMVDTHFHSYDLSHPTLRYEWLSPDSGEHHNLGDIRPIKAPRYWLEDFLAESRRSHVIKAIHIEADISDGSPVEETRWVQSAADRTGFPLGIVARVDLRRDDVPAILEQHYEYPGMRGVRDLGAGSFGDVLDEPAFIRGVRHLNPRQAVLDVGCAPENLHKLRELAAAAPDVTIVVEHAARPERRDEEYFVFWRAALREAAEIEKCVIKIDGLGMKNPDWTVESLRPWVLTCIDVFGADRAMFGTNWPVDRLTASYRDLTQAYREIIADFSDDDRRSLLRSTAESVYRI